MPEADYDYSGYTDDSNDHIDDVTARLNRAAEDMFEAARRVAEKEDELKKAKQAFNDLADRRVPELMTEAGYDQGGKHKVREGLEVQLVDRIRASIPVARRPEAYRWLDDHGHGGMIKRSFEIKFSKDQEKLARKFAADLKRRKIQLPCERKDKVEPQTLLSFVKESLREGMDLPLDLFGVHQLPSTKIV